VAVLFCWLFASSFLCGAPQFVSAPSVRATIHGPFFGATCHPLLSFADSPCVVVLPPRPLLSHTGCCGPIRFVILSFPFFPPCVFWSPPLSRTCQCCDVPVAIYLFCMCLLVWCRPFSFPLIFFFLLFFISFPISWLLFL